jgi:hypothetical protein
MRMLRSDVSSSSEGIGIEYETEKNERWTSISISTSIETATAKNERWTSISIWIDVDVYEKTAWGDDPVGYVILVCDEREFEISRLSHDQSWSGYVSSSSFRCDISVVSSRSCIPT